MEPSSHNSADRKRHKARGSGQPHALSLVGRDDNKGNRIKSRIWKIYWSIKMDNSRRVRGLVQDNRPTDRRRRSGHLQFIKRYCHNNNNNHKQTPRRRWSSLATHKFSTLQNRVDLCENFWAMKFLPICTESSAEGQRTVIIEWQRRKTKAIRVIIWFLSSSLSSTPALEGSEAPSRIFARLMEFDNFLSESSINGKEIVGNNNTSTSCQ